MRTLWLSFLLIGHITCVPIGQDYGSTGAGPTLMQAPFSSGNWYSGTGMSSGSGSSSPQPSLTNPSSDKATELPAPRDAVYYVPSSYGSTNMAGGEAFGSGYASYNSPGVAYAGYPYAFSAPAGSYGGGYGSSAGGYEGYGSYGYAPAPRDEAFGSAGGQGAGDEVPEPVFSDVSDLEPVYSFNSRSNYQRGRAMFAQTRYTPEESVAPLMPVSKTASKQRSPAKDTKGRYN